MMHGRVRAAWTLVAFALFAAPCPPSAAEEGGVLTQVRYSMGTLWTVEARGPKAEEAIAQAFAEVKRLDESLSTYRPESELSRVNREAAKRWVTVSPETMGLLRRALAYAEETGGAFDPTVGPLVRAWGFKYLDYQVPPAARIAEARAKVGYRKVRLDPAKGVRFSQAGVELDLGAIAKGYAVDRALAVMQRHGAVAARVDAGGNQGVWGLPPAGQSWFFGIKHPRSEGDMLGVVPLSSGGISTSGDNERGFWKDGVRYGHIVDPTSGAPVKGMVSVTVRARTAEEADALSTCLYVLGEERGEALLARHPDASALYVRAGSAPGEFRTTVGAGFEWEEESDAAP
ncbi:FAD:protein FMN transferase [bacterium]|nr:FAD:protein FMN transferase [bacterium]